MLELKQIKNSEKIEYEFTINGHGAEDKTNVSLKGVACDTAYYNILSKLKDKKNINVNSTFKFIYSVQLNFLINWL